MRNSCIMDKTPTYKLSSCVHSPPPPPPPVFSGVCVTRSLVLCVCFADRWLSLCTFSFGHVLSVLLLRYTNSDYPFGIFKLSLLDVYVIFHWNTVLNIGKWFEDVKRPSSIPHYMIISLQGEIRSNKISITSPLFIEVPLTKRGKWKVMYTGLCV